MKKIVNVFIGIILVFICCSCSNNKIDESKLLGINFDVKKNEVKLDSYDTENPVVCMYIENYGAIVMELYPKKAENTVNNFISLVKSGFYDNNTFHRLDPGFVLQGGDPTGTGTGNPGYLIKGEFTNNGYSNNDLKHEEKIVSMARSSSMDSGGSQFFIMLGESSSLDGDYAAFGKVIDGWDIIKEIENNEIVENETTGKLQTNLTIKKSLVDTKGKTYKEVEKIEE